MICVHGGPCTGCMNCIVVDESLAIPGDPDYLKEDSEEPEDTDYE